MAGKEGARRTYYDVLGCVESSSAEQIATEYKHLALKLHPDKHHQEGSSDAFKAVSEAYKVLSDPETRAAYDRYLHCGLLDVTFEEWNSKQIGKASCRERG
mmetsp:Transcript_15228/g.59555  ORF Transcript_15228/g.59555 Transcript_15228/m.59555 type:complete len:101 (-) Transcript_15228:25-327(-)